MPKPLTSDEAIRRKVAQEHVIGKSLTPASRRLAMGLPLYSCSCGEWDSYDANYGDHVEAVVAMLTRPTEVEQPTFDIRQLTDDQRSLADDIASAMDFGHEDNCAVWWEDPDGCSCPLLLSVASGLVGARIVEVTQEWGYDPATRRGDRLQRQSFNPHPLTPAAPGLDVDRLADFILGKIEAAEYQGLHPELASMGLAVAIRDEYLTLTSVGSNDER